MDVLFLMAHVDDEVMGCGGYIAKLCELKNKVNVVFLSDGITRGIDMRNHAMSACNVLGVNNVQFLGLQNTKFNTIAHGDINKKIEALNLSFDMIVTNSPTDAHFDHAIAFHAALVIGRPIKKQIKILVSETLSSSEWGSQSFQPNFYVDIKNTIEKKKEAMSKYEHEVRYFPHPRSYEGINIKAKQRGMEVGLEMAEAYQIIRWFE